MIQQASTNLDLISDASFLSNEGKLSSCRALFISISSDAIIHFFTLGDGDCNIKAKQVRFGAPPSSLKKKAINISSLVDGLPQEDPPGCDESRVREEAPLHSLLPIPATLSESLDLSVLDEPHLQQTLEALSLDTPKINTVRVLQEEVTQIASRIRKASQSVRLKPPLLQLQQTLTINTH